jgi:hypothetical membrane protein
MKTSQMINSFTDKYPLVGPIFWIVSVQYYVTQIVAAKAWALPYSWSQNTISDLGNTSCTNYAGRFVCSPDHSLMNASFIVLGLTMIVGSVLVYQEFKESQLSLLGFSFMGIAGLGTLLVGLFPENSIMSLHALGAGLPFLIGNLGLVILGFVLDLPKTLRYYTLLSGFISLIALGLFISHTYLGLGQGGMERVTAYPQTMWLIVFGVYTSGSHIKSMLAKKV